jgi:hypothetical protein
MDLLDRINRTAFLGKEFLTWLWFMSDAREGLFRDVKGQEPFEVWFDDKLVLDHAIDKVKEVNSIKGESPTETAEAHTALRVGKKVADAKLRVIKDEREWVCSIKGEELALSGVKVPAVLSREEDEQVLERLELLGELERVLDALYRDFLEVRLDAERWPKELEKLRAWVFADRGML